MYWESVDKTIRYAETILLKRLLGEDHLVSTLLTTPVARRTDMPDIHQQTIPDSATQAQPTSK